MMRHYVCAMAAMAIGFSEPALAQPILPYRLEMRIVPQVGVLPGPITDLDGTKHVPVDTSRPAADDRTRRFEVQYRLIDLDPSDEFRTGGLAATVMQLTTSTTGNVNGSLIRKARLSMYEARLADSSPPSQNDSSGLPTTGTFTGLHRPFRGALMDDAASANGRFVGLTQTFEIDPLCLAPNSQGSADLGYTGLEWYGLYSFEVIAASNAIGSITVTASPIPDVQTHTAFAMWMDDGRFVSAGATEYSSTSASVVLVPIPSGSLIAGLVLLVSPRPRRH
jgi:hypothetical protein